MEIQSKWNHRVDNGDECEAAPLRERVNSFQTRADAEIWLRSGLRNRAACRSSWWWAALCSSPVTVYCTSLSGTSVSGLWRKGYSQVTEFYDKTIPATANVPLCFLRLQSTNDPYFSVFKRNEPSCFHKHARAESREGFITVQATTAYHIKKGSHSSKHPLFLWSADTIGGVWRALSSDLSLKDVSRPPGSGRHSNFLSFLQRATDCTFYSWINQADKD